MQYVWLFLAGALLCNALPHLSSGLQGQPFPTPFAKPRGVGDSPPLVNTVWGFVNLLLALLIAAHHWNPVLIVTDATAMLLGGLAIGIYLSLHFGKVQRDRLAR